MIPTTFSTNNNLIAGLKDDDESYCYFLWNVICFILFCVENVLLSKEEFLQETSCILVNKSHEPFQYTGQPFVEELRSQKYYANDVLLT